MNVYFLMGGVREEKYCRRFLCRLGTLEQLYILYTRAVIGSKNSPGTLVAELVARGVVEASLEEEQAFGSLDVLFLAPWTSVNAFFAGTSTAFVGHLNHLFIYSPSIAQPGQMQLHYLST